MAKPSTNTLLKRTAQEEFDRGREDPVKFAWDFLGLSLHPAQERFLYESSRPGIKEGNLSAGNRFGKGEVIAVKALWAAFYQHRNERFAYDAQGLLRPYTAINCSISLDQASIVFNKAAGYAQASKKMQRFIDKIVYSPFPEIRFKKAPGARQGAEFWARSLSHGAKYLLGQNFQYLNMDEASLEPNGETIMNDVVRMRMADSGGNIDTTSQPRGKGWWYAHFLRGVETINGLQNAIYDPHCYSQHGASFDNPYIDHEHIRRSMKYMTESQIQENIYGQFTDANQFFPADQVMACYKDQDYTLPVLPGHDLVVREYRTGETYSAKTEARANPETQARYVMGVDLAAKQDQTCIVILRVDVQPWQMVLFELHGKTNWRIIKNRVAAAHKQYRAWGLADSTGAGGPILEDLIGEHDCDLEGYNFGGSAEKKLTLLYELQLAIQNREFVFPLQGDREGEGTKPLLDQLINYRLDDKKLQTDAVFGLALAVKAARDLAARDAVPTIFTPDVAAVSVRRDPATGLPLLHNAAFDDDEDWEDEATLRGLGVWRHLVADLPARPRRNDIARYRA